MRNSTPDLRGLLPRQSTKSRPRTTAELHAIQRAVDRLSRWMDTCYVVPGLGWRFGLDPLVGLIPVVGDLAATLVAIYIVMLSARCGVPKITVVRMAVNVAIDLIVGALPVVGDLFDFWWKANKRNAVLLHHRLHETPAELHRAELHDWLFVGLVSLALLAILAATIALAATLAHLLWQALDAVWPH